MINKKKALQIVRGHIRKTLQIEIYGITGQRPSSKVLFRSGISTLTGDCWYITCPAGQGERQLMLDGNERLIVISKKTGKVIHG